MYCSFTKLIPALKAHKADTSRPDLSLLNHPVYKRSRKLKLWGFEAVDPEVVHIDGAKDGTDYTVITVVPRAISLIHANILANDPQRSQAILLGDPSLEDLVAPRRTPAGLGHTT